MSDDSGGYLARPAVSWALIAVATVLGGALRLGGLESPSLWVDEFFTIGRAGLDPVHWSYWLGYQPSTLSLWLAGADLSQVSIENIVRWQALGVNERAARLGPCLVGIASIPVLGALTRVALGPAIAASAALLLAVLPFHIYWSQMARYYTMEFLFANAFVLLLVHGVQTGKTAWLVAAVISGVLAFSSHFTAVFVVGGCFGLCVVAWLARVQVQHLNRGLAAAALSTTLCAVLLLLKELQVPEGKTLSSFSDQAWDPSVQVLVMGGILRFEPLLCVAGCAAIWQALRQRDLPWLLIAGVAVGVPLGVLMLKVVFPVGPRYVFAIAFLWILLASAWCAEIDRKLSVHGSGLLGATGLAVLLVGVGFNTFLHVRDGAGARERWREAFQYVSDHAKSGEPVYTRTARFQGAYYLQRPIVWVPNEAALHAADPGSWIVHRTMGTRSHGFAPPVESRERFEIPSKPWSWQLHVLHVPPRD